MIRGLLPADLLAVLVASFKPVADEFFRKVELEWAHPDDVVSGEGTSVQGNRFVRRGKHAVYASLSEETALQEYKYGQAKAFGRFLKPNVAHITYPIRIEAERSVDLSAYREDPRFRDVLAAALEPGEHEASQVLGDQVIAAGAQAIIFPSAVPGHDGKNIVCILDTVPRPLVRVDNYDEIIAKLRKIGGARRPRP